MFSGGGFTLVKRNSIILKWFVSYSLLLLIPLVISMLFYSNIEEILVSEINQSNEVLLNQLQKEVDDTLNTQKRVFAELAFNNSLNELLSARTELSNKQNYVAHKAFQEMRGLSISNGIDNMYVYFHELDIAITPDGVTDGLTLYKTYHNWDNGYESWKNFIKNTRYTYDNLDVIINSEQKGRMISFIAALPINAGNHKATAVIMIDEKRITDKATELLEMNGGEMVVLDADNNVLVSTTSKSADALNFNRLLDKNRDTIKKTSDGDYVVAYTSSAVNTWKYVVFTNEKNYWRQLQQMRDLIILSIILSLIIGVIINLVLVKKNYSPINQLKKQIKSMHTSSSAGGEDDYSFILKAITNAIDERDSISNEFEKQKIILRNNFLYKCLKGSISEYTFIDDYLKKFDIQFLSDSFIVSVFYVKNYENLLASENEDTIKEKYELLQLIPMNIIEELIGQKHKCYVLEVDSFMVALINLSSKEENEEYDGVMSEIEKGIEFIENNFGVLVNVGLSDIHNTYYGISECYREAYETVEYMQVTGMTGAVPYSNVRNINDTNYYYPIEKEIQLTNLIKAGDNEGAKEIVAEVIRKNFEGNKPNIKITKCLIFDLISTMLKVVENDENYYDKFNDSDYFNKLLRCENIREMKLLLGEVIDQLCENTKKIIEERTRKIEPKIKEYIEKNYHQYSLSVAGIGMYFGLDPSYLSKLFREETGETLLDYINRVRVEKAKTLMLTTEYSLEKIAQKVGFLDTRALGRVFKRIEGIVPSKYREIEKNEGNQK